MIKDKYNYIQDLAYYIDDMFNDLEVDTGENLECSVIIINDLIVVKFGVIDSTITLHVISVGKVELSITNYNKGVFDVLPTIANACNTTNEQWDVE